MAVDESKVIDIAGISRVGPRIILTISDHLDWAEPDEHVLILQEKLNTYLRFTESGEIYEQFPDARGLPVVFHVVFNQEPVPLAVEFLERARGIVEGAGVSLTYERFGGSTIH